ncbi:MAG: MarR family transcriptional regulator [Tepidisphaeraceae bacterium]|jgi:DNA-binding MarR family transcriptional regulator
MSSATVTNPAEIESVTEGALRALIRAFGLIKHVMEPYFAGYGLTGAQWGILRVLGRVEKEGMTALRLSDLGKRLLVRPPSVTGLVGRMHRAGLVELTPSAEDQRVKNVSLTPAGRRLLARVLSGHGAQIESMLKPLSGEQRVQLQGLLEQVAGRMEQLAGQAGARPASVSRGTENSD